MQNTHKFINNSEIERITLILTGSVLFFVLAFVLSVTMIGGIYLASAMNLKV